MHDEAKRTSVSAQGSASFLDPFEEDRESGNSALRNIHRAKLNSDIEDFTRVASLVDLMLLREVLGTWRSYVLAGEEKTVLAGAMAELFRRTEPEPPDPGTSAGTADAGTAETDDAPRIVRQAQSRSEKRAAQWTVVERCQSAFRDWLHNAHSAAEIALITNVFGLGESDGDLIGNFLDHINLDRDKILGQDVPEQTKGRSAHA
jgi:hypothetical protein